MMNKVFLLLSSFIVFVGTPAFAQMPDISYYQLLNPQYEVGSDEEAMDKIQALFIQQIFVGPLFNSTDVIEFEEEDSIYNTKQSNELMNVIYARELSRYLAEQDILNLDDYFMEQ